MKNYFQNYIHHVPLVFTVHSVSVADRAEHIFSFFWMNITFFLNMWTAVHLFQILNFVQLPHSFPMVVSEKYPPPYFLLDRVLWITTYFPLFF